MLNVWDMRCLPGIPHFRVFLPPFTAIFRYVWQTGVRPNTTLHLTKKLDDGWPESEKDVFQAALRMVVVKDSRWIVGEFYMSYGKIWCEKVRLIKKRKFGKGHQMTCVLQPQRERGGRDKERERKREKEKARERERMKGGVERKHGEM